jgi:hypothetical protein
VRISVRLLLSVLAGMALALPASASVIYSTFGPGDSFDGSSGETLSYACLLGSCRVQNVGIPFTPSTDVRLGSVLVAIQTPLDFTIRVANNVDYTSIGGSNSPGSTIESFFLPAETSAGLVWANSVLNPLLLAGTMYWIEVDPNPDWLFPQTGTLFNNNQGLTGTITTNIDFCKIFCPPLAENNVTLPAVEVDTPVPEPCSVALLGTGLAALLVKRRRAAAKAA